jgi:hypothetical protein
MARCMNFFYIRGRKFFAAIKESFSFLFVSWSQCFFPCLKRQLTLPKSLSKIVVLCGRIYLTLLCYLCIFFVGLFHFMANRIPGTNKTKRQMRVTLAQAKHGLNGPDGLVMAVMVQALQDALSEKEEVKKDAQRWLINDWHDVTEKIGWDGRQLPTWARH